MYKGRAPTSRPIREGDIGEFTHLNRLFRLIVHYKSAGALGEEAREVGDKRLDLRPYWSIRSHGRYDCR